MQPQEKVVYPGHGVAIIDEFVERVVGGSTTTFLKLRIVHNDTIILVPVDRDGHCRAIRQLSTQAEIRNALDELSTPAKKIDAFDNTPSGWNKRNKIYQMRLQRGLLIDVAATYRDLMHTARHKELSFGEKQLVASAEDLLVQEICAATGDHDESIRHMLRACVNEPLLGMSLHGHRPHTLVA